MEDPVPSPPLPKSYNILSLDGGGIRGIVEAVLLARLEQEHKNFIRDTDLLTGTSTGGIIALALAADIPASKIQELYMEQSKIIFKDSLLDDVKDLWKLGGADYSTQGMREVLRDSFGDMKLRDLNKRVAIVAFDLDNKLKDPRRRTWKPKVFHNFEGLDSDGDLDVADVGLYTTAAPLFFPSVDGYIDGAVVANNPAMVGIVQALDRRALGKSLQDLHVFSIGTKKTNRYIEGDNLDWGLVKWAPQLLYILFEGAISMVTFECEQLLGYNFHRLEPILDGDFGMDNWKEIPDLARVAESEDLGPTLEWLEEHWL